MALVQPYLVLQLYLIPGQSFTLELIITDISNTKRRLLFSSASKEITSAPLHARIPNWPLTRGSWANISIDIISFTDVCFPGCTYRSLESITVHSFCKIRKIFTMKKPIFDSDSQTHFHNCENVPKNLDFPSGVGFVNQNIVPDLVIDPEKSGLSLRSKKDDVIFEDRIPVSTAPVVRNPSHTRQKTVSPNRKPSFNTSASFFPKNKLPDKSPIKVNRKGSASLVRSKPPHKLRTHSLAEVENQNAINPDLIKQKRFSGYGGEPYSKIDTPSDLSEIKESIVIEKSMKNLSNCGSFVIAQSIQEEIEIERMSPEIEHNFYPEPKNYAMITPIPNFYEKGLSELTKMRPFTPPFAGLASMKNIGIPLQDSGVNQLIFDTVLNCYYDPSTQEYFEINN